MILNLFLIHLKKNLNKIRTDCINIYIKIKTYYVSGKGKSCKAIKDFDPSSVSGVYEIENEGGNIHVRCEMNTASGGWAVSLNISYNYN